MGSAVAEGLLPSESPSGPAQSRPCWTSGPIGNPFFELPEGLSFGIKYLFTGVQAAPYRNTVAGFFSSRDTSPGTGSKEKFWNNFGTQPP